jgi:nucleoside-diphosphate-sugar epimerase
MELKGVKILVTGASGFIGSRLTKKLLKNNAEVHAISRRKHTGDSKIHWHKGDLSDLNFVKDIVQKIKPTYIYHLASHVCGSRNYQNMELTFNNNLVTAFNLLLAVHNDPVKRLIMAGSFEEINSNEEDLRVPSSPYAASKYAALNYARSFHKLYNTPVCMASIYMVYGPGQKDLSKLIPYVTLKALNNEAPELTSGNRKIDWVYVDDVVDGLIKMLTAPNIEGHSIEIGSGESILTRDIVKTLISKITSKVKPKFGALNDRPMEQEKVANAHHTYKKIGWKASTNLITGLNKTIEYYSNLKRTNELLS